MCRLYHHTIAHTLKSWAEANGFKYRDVSEVIRGIRRGNYGTGRDIRIKLGLPLDNNALDGTPEITRIDPRADFRWTLSSPGRGIPFDTWNFATRPIFRFCRSSIIGVRPAGTPSSTSAMPDASLPR